MTKKPKGNWGGKRERPPGKEGGRPRKREEEKARHIRPAISEPESSEEKQAIEWWMGLTPKERLAEIVRAHKNAHYKR